MTRPALAKAAALTAAALLGVLGAGTTATAAPTTAPATAATTPHAALSPAIVSMGDSAISGEGAGTDTDDGYVAGTDGPSDYCHRSTKSEIFDTGLSGVTAVDLACSGAQTGDLVSDPTLAKTTGGGSGDFGEPKQDAQLARTAAQYDVKMVVVTIGANDDFDFSGIMESCLGQYFPIPQSQGCRDTIGSATITARAKAVVPKIEAALTDVRQTMRTAGYADGSYQLVMQSYFTPITPDIRTNTYAGKVADGCPAFPEDLAWGHNWVVPQLDDALRTAAEAVPGVRFLDQRRVSYGHEVCAEMTTSPYEYTNGDVIDTSELTRNGCDYSIGILGLCEDEIRQSYHLRVAGYEGEGACLGEFYGEAAQQEAYCTLDDADGTTIEPLTPGQPFQDKPEDGSWYQLTNHATGQVLDLSGGGSYGDDTDGRPAITYPADGGLNQSFVFEAKSGGSYELDFSGNRDMCLDANGASTAAGTALQQWGCDGGANQHWVFESAGGGLYKLADSQDTSMVATLGTSAKTDSSGNPVTVLQPDTGASTQLWQLTKLGIVYLP
ncbi:RICIN domain-containing protein [Streptomyces sp. PTM05]|uniref:RICIN domain-containing protein n=1 Tax=Streptantibioticus parmotrematis TaxID=2873249 RepID=A0ABS7QT66_9ACTN|nr:RICIN domain-containing protein [Streptantibioticus parmotrematis]MBY8886376.1 RICIN domain-containing protein [Streptantibioticus parmotrematis]